MVNNSNISQVESFYIKYIQVFITTVDPNKCFECPLFQSWLKKPCTSHTALAFTDILAVAITSILSLNKELCHQMHVVSEVTMKRYFSPVQNKLNLIISEIRQAPIQTFCCCKKQIYNVTMAVSCCGKQGCPSISVPMASICPCLY